MKEVVGLPFGRDRRFVPSVLERFILSFVTLDDVLRVFWVSKALCAQSARYLAAMKAIEWSGVMFDPKTVNKFALGVTVQHCRSLVTLRQTTKVTDLVGLAFRWLSRLTKNNAATIRSVRGIPANLTQLVMPHLLQLGCPLQELHLHPLPPAVVHQICAAFPKINTLAIEGLDEADVNTLLLAGNLVFVRAVTLFGWRCRISFDLAGHRGPRSQHAQPHRCTCAKMDGNAASAPVHAAY